MAYEEVTNDSHRKRRKRVLIGGAVALATIIVFSVVLGLSLTVLQSHNLTESESLKKTVIGRCETYLKEKNWSGVSECESIWQAFEQAYVGRDHCDVPPEAYDLLIRRQQQLACSTMLFWSKTMEIAHAFTKNRKCLRTLEHTLLGSMFDHLNWCSKNQSKETFTTGCPDWHSCVNNPKRSFWIRASDNFASTACGNVSAMLNGSLEAPFDSSSVFGDVEVKKLNSTKVHSLTVLLVAQDTDKTTCENASFKNLKSTLNPNIAYNCKVVPFTRVQDCISNLDIPCGDCLSPRSLG